MKRVAIYIRIGSKVKSHTGNGVDFDEDPTFQEEILRHLIFQRGWLLHQVYRDHIRSGYERRRGMERMLADARLRKFDVMMVWRLDQFTRSLTSPLKACVKLRALGIDFVSHTQGWDTTKGQGMKALGVFVAESLLKRSLLRVALFDKIAKNQSQTAQAGKTILCRRSPRDRKAVMKLRRRGYTWRAIANDLGVGLDNVWWILAGNVLGRWGGVREASASLRKRGCWL